MDRPAIAAAADDVLARLRELGGPNDAVTALMMAHVKLTLEEDMNADKVASMLGDYAAAFKEMYFG